MISLRLALRMLARDWRAGELTVLGIALVLALLALRWGRAPIAAASDVLLGHLSLLFVPVGVGVVTHLDALAAHGVALVAVLLVSTWVGLAVTALVLRALLTPR